MRECDDTDDAEQFGAEVCFVTSVSGRPWLRLLSKSMSTIFHKNISVNLTRTFHIDMMLKTKSTFVLKLLNCVVYYSDSGYRPLLFLTPLCVSGSLI